MTEVFCPRTRHIGRTEIPVALPKGADFIWNRACKVYALRNIFVLRREENVSSSEIVLAISKM